MTVTSEPDAKRRNAFYQSHLVPHPSTAGEAVHSIEVRLDCAPGGALEIAYVLVGDPLRVRWPPPTQPRRLDGLWRRTCFEAFLGNGPGSDYIELNFSPSGAWAAYAFSGYRVGMAALDRMAAPEIASFPRDPSAQVCGAPAGPGGSSWRVMARVRLAALGAAGALRVALAAVIEEAGGRLTYWALGHPPGPPDFHHPDAFVLWN